MATSSTTLSIRDRLDRRLPVRARPNRDPTLTILCAGTSPASPRRSPRWRWRDFEGRGALQPLNATSHWLHGGRAGRARELTARESAVGLATHHISALFWAVPYSLWLDREPDRSTGEIVGGAAATAALAGVRRLRHHAAPPYPRLGAVAEPARRRRHLRRAGARARRRRPPGARARQEGAAPRAPARRR